MSSIYDLNGEWDIIFDTNNAGVDLRWYANPPELDMVSQVPNTWEKEFGKYPGSIAFYFRRFNVDESFNAKRTFLRFLGSSYHTTVWLNGKLLGVNHGGFHTFDFNVAKALKTDEENLLCVRVASMAANRIEGVAVTDLPVGTDFPQIPFGGIWRGVELINGGKSCLLGANVIPDADTGKIEIEMRFSNPRNHSTRLLFIVKTPSGEMTRLDKEIKLEKEDSSIKVPLQVKEWDKWDVDNPNIYTLEIFMERTFSVKRTFGFRKIDIYRSDLYCNDAALKIQGMVYTQSHPLNGVMVDDEKIVRKDLKSIKAMGFNAIRSGGFPLGEIALDICDEIGLMVFQDIPIQSQRSSKDGLEVARELVERLITTQKTHPCIAVWVMGSDNGTLLLENGTKLLKHVDLFDDTRPVVSNLNNLFLSTNEDLRVDTGKVIGVTNDKVILYNSHRIQSPLILNADESTLFANYMSEGTENAVTESVSFGSEFKSVYNDVLSQTSVVKATLQIDLPPLATDFISLPKKYTTAARNQNHGKRVNNAAKSWAAVVKKAITESKYEDEVDFRKDFNDFRLKRTLNFIDTALSSSQVSGYFLNRYRDVAQCFDGLLDEFHREKTDLSELPRHTLQNRLLFSGLEGAFVPKTPLNFRLRYLNVKRIGDVVLQVELTGEKGGKALQTFESKFETVGSVFPFEGIQFTAPEKSGSYLLKATLLKDGKVVDEHQAPFAVLAVKEVKTDSVSILQNVSHKALESACNKSLPILLEGLADIDKHTLLLLKNWVNEGNQVVLLNLKPEELTEVIEAELLPNCELVSSSGAFHFFANDDFGLSSAKEKYVSEVYAGVVPKYSLSLEFSEDFLASAFELDQVGADWLCDLVAHPLGKGKVWVHQYDLLQDLPVAKELLQNLIKNL